MHNLRDRASLRRAVVALAAVLLAAPLAIADDFGMPPPPDAPLPTTDAAPVSKVENTPVVDQTQQVMGEGGNSGDLFDLKTKALQEQVNDLKEKIFRTKIRLAQLGEVVLGGNGTMTGAKLSIWHRNELGSSYVLVAAAYTLDGAPVFTKVDETGDLNEREEFSVYDLKAIPGQHQMAVQYELRGHGYGIFSYLEGMRLKLRASYQFSVEQGKITKVTSCVREKEGITLEFKDKPDVRFEQNVQKDVGKPPDAAEQAAPAAPTGAGK